MTIEEIMAAMQAIIDGAQGRPLTDDEVTRYEALESDLTAANRDQQIRARNAAYNTVVVPAGVPSGRPAADEATAEFRNYLLTGRVTNAQSEGVPSQGGYLVPDEFRVKLVEKLKAF